MKKIILLSLLIVAGFITSCDKSDEPIDTSNQSLFLELRNFETGEYKIGDVGANETVSYIEQPMHAEINTLFIDEEGQVFYTYKAVDGYDGTDFVSFEKTSQSNGEVTVESTLHLNFRVTN